MVLYVIWPTSSRRLPQRPPEQVSDPPRLAVLQCHVPRHHLVTARSLRPFRVLGKIRLRHFGDFIPLTLIDANSKHLSLRRLFCFVWDFSCYFQLHIGLCYPQWSRNEFEVEEGTCPVRSVGKFFRRVLHFLALQLVTIIVSVSAFVVVSTVWSVYCLLFFYV